MPSDALRIRNNFDNISFLSFVHVVFLITQFNDSVVYFITLFNDYVVYFITLFNVNSNVLIVFISASLPFAIKTGIPMLPGQYG